MSNCPQVKVAAASSAAGPRPKKPRMASAPSRVLSPATQLRLLQDRTRKDFAALSVHLPSDRSVALPAKTVCKVQWSVQAADVQRIMSYWDERSALHAIGIPTWLHELGSPVRRKAARVDEPERLVLSVWALSSLLQAHVDRYPPVLTQQGQYFAPPLVLHPYHLVPLSAGEATALRKKKRLASFCELHMHWHLENAKDALSRSSLDGASPSALTADSQSGVCPPVADRAAAAASCSLIPPGGINSMRRETTGVQRSLLSRK